MADEKKFDWEHIHQLLNISNLAKQWPNLKRLHDAAMVELEEISNPKPEPEPAPKRKVIADA